MPTWLTSALSAIAGIPSAIAAFFGYQKQRDAEKNTPAMEANAQARADEREAEKIKQDIAAAHAGEPQALEDDEA